LSGENLPDTKTADKKPGKKGQETFEEGLGRLEAIVGELESRSLSLDAAILAFEEGMRLSDELGKKLNAAEARLEIISKGPDGGPSAAPMEPPSPPSFDGPAGGGENGD
jgi:exodeoxyribonuclease VII small subunit